MKRATAGAKVKGGTKLHKFRSQEWRDLQCLPEPETPIEKFEAMLTAAEERVARKKAATALPGAAATK